MSTRQYLPSALRQCRSAVSQMRQQPQLQHQQAKQISTTAAHERGLRQVSQPRGHAKILSDLGNEPAANSSEVLRSLLGESGQRRAGSGNFMSRTELAMEDLRRQATTDQYTKMMPRSWRTGEVYAPRDLGVGEMKKWQNFTTPKKDVIDQLGIHPLDNYRNFAFVSEFMTPYGRIRSIKDTGLRPVNQRKIAKTIRRAIGLGIHPSVHFHPELLKIRYRNQSLPQVSSPKKKEDKNASTN